MPEVVISNTSPLQYLHQLGHLELLPHFYQQIQIPPAVTFELSAGRELGIPLPDPTTIDWLQETVPTGDITLSLATTLGAGDHQLYSNGTGKALGNFLCCSPRAKFPATV